MPKSRGGRIVFGIIVAVTLFIMGRNWYCRIVNQRLLDAFERNDVAQTLLLLRRGANPDAPILPGSRTMTQNAFANFTHGRDPAANQRRDAILCLYIEYGANIRDSSPSGQTFMRQVCQAGSPDIARLLLENHIPVTADDFDTAFWQWVALHPIQGPIPRPSGAPSPSAAMRIESENLIRLLFAAGQKLDLWQATRMEDLPAMRAALAQGANVNMVKSSWGTALTIAAQTGNMAAAQLLLEHGASVDGDSVGDTPLRGALACGHADIASLLLAHGADVNRVTKLGGSPLAAAIAYAPQFVPELLRRGANVRAPDALTAALAARNTALVSDLLRLGAIVNPPPPPAPPETREVAHIAASASAGLRRPVPVPVPTTTPLAIAVARAPEYVPLLLKAGADVRHANRSILILAARSGRADVVPLLLQAGADVNARDELGETPLTTALQHAPAMVPLLLAHGANPNLPNQLERAPLAIAAMQGDSANVRLLLARKADANAVTSSGHSALYFARQHSHTEIAALLQQAGAK